MAGPRGPAVMAPRKAKTLRGGGDTSLQEHLIASAARLISQRGTAGLSVRDIAHEARLATGVLYNHFADKEELVAYALHAHVRNVETGLGGPPPTPGSHAVQANLIGYVNRSLVLHAAIMPAFAGLLSQPGVLAKFASLPNPVAAGQGLRDQLADYLRAEQRLGRLAHQASADTAATMIIGACHELILPHLFSGTATTSLNVPRNFAVDLITTILDGIGIASHGSTRPSAGTASG